MFILRKIIFLAPTNFFFHKIYVITNTPKTRLSCSILKCFNQVYESNERKRFLRANAKLCRTQTSFNSFNCIYITRKLILKYGVLIGIP